jgi:gluconokinase
MIVVLMGVTGSGKTTIGRLLAHALGWAFYDADDFHSVANIDKMHQGIPLTDEDRKPWLQTLARLVNQARDRGDNIVLACSALKHAYQEYLRHDLDIVHYVVLRGSPEIIRRRLEARTDHFMNPSLLRSQLEILEPPDDAIQVDVAGTPPQIVEEIRRKLGLPRSPIPTPSRMLHALELVALTEKFAVCSLPADRAIPEWATRGEFCSLTRTPVELSIVCREADVPDDVMIERGWRCVRVEGQLDFSMVGVIASLVKPLAVARVPVFVVSTFRRDYLLVKSGDFDRAVSALRDAGHCLLPGTANYAIGC